MGGEDVPEPFDGGCGGASLLLAGAGVAGGPVIGRWQARHSRPAVAQRSQ